MQFEAGTVSSIAKSCLMFESIITIDLARPWLTVDGTVTVEIAQAAIGILVFLTKLSN
jgi:hypothetical protein